MIYRLILCASVLFGFLSITNADEDYSAKTKTFSEPKCSYTLPDEDWKWMDENALERLKQQWPEGKPVTAALKQTGLIIAITFIPERANQRTDAKSLESFELGFLSTGRATKRKEGKHITFKGVPTYQFEATMKNGQELSIRIFFANNKFYQIFAISLGKMPPDDEVERAYQGFNFVENPKIPTQNQNSGHAQTSEAFERGKAAAPCFNCICGLFVVAIVGTIIASVILLNRKKPTRDDLDDDRPLLRRRSRRNGVDQDEDDGDDEEYDAGRRRRSRREDDDDDRPPRRRRLRDEDEDDDERPPRRRRPRNDEDD
jgi:hypothetical protein